MPIPVALLGRMSSLILARKTARPPQPPSLRITVNAEGVTIFVNRLLSRLVDFRPFWVHYFAPVFFDDIQRNFATSGRYVGGWRALSPAYAAWKLSRYGSRPILVLTGAMRESLRIGGRGNIMRAGARTFEGGSTDPKLPKHQKGLGVPVRQVLFVRQNSAYQRLLRQYVADMTREARGGTFGTVSMDAIRRLTA